MKTVRDDFRTVFFMSLFHLLYINNIYICIYDNEQTYSTDTFTATVQCLYLRCCGQLLRKLCCTFIPTAPQALHHARFCWPHPHHACPYTVIFSLPILPDLLGNFICHVQTDSINFVILASSHKYLQNICVFSDCLYWSLASNQKRQYIILFTSCTCIFIKRP